MTAGRRKVGRTGSPELRRQAAELVARYLELDRIGAFTREGAKVLDEDGTESILTANPYMLVWALERFAATGQFYGDRRLTETLYAMIRHPGDRTARIGNLSDRLGVSEKAAEELLSEKGLKSMGIVTGKTKRRKK